jgi:hypothetical protein
VDEIEDDGVEDEIADPAEEDMTAVTEDEPEDKIGTWVSRHPYKPRTHP